MLLLSGYVLAHTLLYELSNTEREKMAAEIRR